MKEEEHEFTPDQAVLFAAQLDDAGRTDEAEGIFRQVLEIAPDHFHATQRLGVALTKKGHLYEALYRFDRALKLNRRSALVLCNRAMVLSRLGHHDEAMIDCHKSLAIQPKNPIVLSNLGTIQQYAGDYVDSLDSLNRAIALDPSEAAPYYNRGVTLIRLNRHEEAKLDFEHALTIAPDFAECHFNLGLVCLYLGDYTRGFAEYEWRWETEEYAEYRAKFPQPKWAGEDLEHKHILLYGDQGLGDAIMFARYVPLVQARGGQIFLVAHKPLAELFRRSFPQVTVFTGGEAMPRIDYRCPLPSLPRAFGTTLATIPPPMCYGGYEDRTGKFRPLFAGKSRPKVGVCWSGNFKHKNDLDRSIDLSEFAKFMNAAHWVDFYSLQVDVRQIDQPHLTDAPMTLLAIKDWADTAAAVSMLDAVVTVDTSVAHLAGSLGVPTKVLIAKHGVDWRWMKDRTDSPWYPSVTLYRQRERHKWAEPFARLLHDLPRTMQAAA